MSLAAAKEHSGFDPAALTALFGQAGIPAPQVAAESGTHPVGSAEDWWTIVLGSGYRSTVNRLDEADVARVRADNLAAMTGVREIEASVVYAVSGGFAT